MASRQNPAHRANRCAWGRRLPRHDGCERPFPSRSEPKAPRMCSSENFTVRTRGFIIGLLMTAQPPLNARYFETLAYLLKGNQECVSLHLIRGLVPAAKPRRRGEIHCRPVAGDGKPLTSGARNRPGTKRTGVGITFARVIGTLSDPRVPHQSDASFGTNGHPIFIDSTSAFFGDIRVQWRGPGRQNPDLRGCPLGTRPYSPRLGPAGPADRLLRDGTIDHERAVRPSG